MERLSRPIWTQKVYLQFILFSKYLRYTTKSPVAIVFGGDVIPPSVKISQLDVDGHYRQIEEHQQTLTPEHVQLWIRDYLRIENSFTATLSTIY